jgi:hypothetical protein
MYINKLTRFAELAGSGIAGEFGSGIAGEFGGHHSSSQNLPEWR